MSTCSLQAIAQPCQSHKLSLERSSNLTKLTKNISIVFLSTLERKRPICFLKRRETFVQKLFIKLFVFVHHVVPNLGFPQNSSISAKKNWSLKKKWPKIDVAHKTFLFKILKSCTCHLTMRIMMKKLSASEHE